MPENPRHNLNLHQRLEQRLLLTHQLVQSLEILQLPLLELTTLVKQEIEENPTIETTEEKPLPEEQTTPSISTNDESPSEKTNALKILDEARGEYQPAFFKRRTESLDRADDIMQNTPAQAITLQDYLYQQFILIEASEKDRMIGQHIIYNIDEQGLLRVPLEEIALMSQSNVEQVVVVLKIIQKLDPSGVGARDSKEQLLLQLDETDPDFELKHELITNHLEDIYQNKLPELANHFGLSLDELKIALDEIKALQFKPGLDFSQEETFYIMPDIIIEEIDDTYEIRITRASLPTLSINSYYRNVLNDPASSTELKNFIRQKIERAQSIIGALHIRQQMLFRITQEIINVQQDFLKYGPTYLKPLTMSDLAQQLSLHLSTVSRAIAQKYIQTPQGIFSMKFFFARATETTPGVKQLKQHLVEALKELVASEDKQNPLSDETLTQELKQKGFNIARRTVAMYRKKLSIPNAQQRKQY